MRLDMLKKIVLFVLLVAAAVFIAACADANTPEESGAVAPGGNTEPNTNVPDTDGIIGAWSGRYSGTYTDDTITFALRDDGTGYIITNGYVRTFTFTYGGGTLVLEYDSEGTMLPVTASCRYDGKDMVLVDFGEKTLLLSDRQTTFITDALKHPEALIGTWSGYESGGGRVTYVFNPDGTGEYFAHGTKSAEEISWSANVNILVISRGVTAVMYEYSEANGMISMSSPAAVNTQLFKYETFIKDMETDSRLYGTWKISAQRIYSTEDPEKYTDISFVSDYRLIFSSDGTAYELRDGSDIVRYSYGVIRGGVAEISGEKVDKDAELYLEQNNNGVISLSYAVYGFDGDLLLIYGANSIRVYKYYSETETAVEDFGIPSRLVGTWIGSLDMEGVTGTILVTLDDDGSGRLVIESDLDVDYFISGTSIAFIYKNENRGYVFAFDLENVTLKLSYRDSMAYTLNRVTENGGVWKKFMVDDKLYGSWSDGSVKYVFDSDGTGYVVSGEYRYRFNYMAADNTLILNIIRSSSVITTAKFSYNTVFTRVGAGDVTV